MKLVNDITPRAIELYGSARIEAVNALRNNFEVTAIYELGTVKVPGISDLDLMMVINAERSKPSKFSNVIDALPESVQTLLDGSTLMVVDPGLFSTIRVWDDIRTKRLWGEDLELTPPPFEPAHLSLARAIDWIPERTLRLAQMTHMESVTTSRALGLIYSLCHSLRMVIAEFDPANSEEIRAYVERVDDLRTSWFATGYSELEEKLLELTRTGFTIGHGLIGLLAGKLAAVGVVGSNTEGELSLGSSGRLIFQDQPHADDTTSPTDSISISTVFYDHFRHYTVGNGSIANSIHSSLQPKPFSAPSGSPNEYVDLLGARLDWVERQAELLQSLGFTSGLYKFGWFYSPTTRGVD